MVLSGATLSAQPCPYCGGVRVIKDGDAFCTGCPSAPSEGPARAPDRAADLDEKIRALADKIASEPDGARRAKLALSMGSLASEAERLRKTG